jgi:hypothetical protein
MNEKMNEKIRRKDAPLKRCAKAGVEVLKSPTLQLLLLLLLLLLLFPSKSLLRVSVKVS